MNPILDQENERNPQEPLGNPQEPTRTTQEPSRQDTNQMNEQNPQEPAQSISSYFKDSAWYKDIIFYLQNLQCPPDMEKS